MPASLLLQLTLFTRLKFKNRLDIIYRTHLNQKFISINCVDMDSIPWEKVLHCVAEKNSRLSQMSKRELAHILPWRREFMERKPHYVLIKKLKSFFYWGSMRPFFIEWFSCFGTKQIYMDGGQMKELALVIWNPSMEMKERKSRFLIWLFFKNKAHGIHAMRTWGWFRGDGHT